jgi:L-asparaginase
MQAFNETVGQRVVFLATGGTIAGQAADAADAVGYRAAQIGIEALLERVPGLAQRLGSWTSAAEQLAQVDSKDMSLSVWQALVRRCQELIDDQAVGAVVVTHGTDTMEESAYLLEQLLDVDAARVVLTGAMRPATAVQADGPQNLLDAVSLATDARARGVWVTFAGRVYAPAWVRKAHPYRLDAFDAGDAGPSAWIEEGQVRWLCAPVSNGDGLAAGHSRAAGRAAFLAAQRWPWVEIIHSHALADARAVSVLVDAGVEGLVVAGTGNGTVHVELERALTRAVEHGVRVLRSTRCGVGRVIGTPADAFASAGSLSPVKARIRLALDLLSREGQLSSAASAR